MQFVKAMGLVCLICATLSLRAQTQGAATTVEVIKWADFEQIMKVPQDQVVVVNFWATWCSPCVKELPYFEALHDEYQDQNVKVYLVSLDDVERVDSRVKPFVARKALTAKVLLLDEPDFNSWISKVANEWTGALPATLIIDGKSGKRAFFEKMFHEGELEPLVTQYLNP